MKRHFLFTFRVLDSPDLNTYQCLLESESGLPDLDQYCEVVEARIGNRDLQYLCHSEFRDLKEVTQFLGKLLPFADVFEVTKKGLIKLKHKADESSN